MAEDEQIEHILNRIKETITANGGTIRELEDHSLIMDLMNLPATYDAPINIHIGGAYGDREVTAAQWVMNFKKLSTNLRSRLTIENDEMCWGIDASLELIHNCALVLDLHHHWVSTGEYIQFNDDRFKKMIDSWRGVRPVIHYSVSKEGLWGNQNPDPG